MGENRVCVSVCPCLCLQGFQQGNADAFCCFQGDCLLSELGESPSLGNMEMRNDRIFCERKSTWCDGRGHFLGPETTPTRFELCDVGFARCVHITNRSPISYELTTPHENLTTFSGIQVCLFQKVICTMLQKCGGLGEVYCVYFDQPVFEKDPLCNHA